MSDLDKALEIIEACELSGGDGPFDQMPEAVAVVKEAARAHRSCQQPDDWPIVANLAKSMRAKLESHRHDRGLDGWKDESEEWLFGRIVEELAELKRNPSWEEAADVANFTAMFVDAALSGDSPT